MSMSTPDESRLEFKVEIKNLRATDLKCRHRFKEKLRVKILFDEKKLKTDKELVGGGDVSWKSNFSFDYAQSSEHTSNLVLEFAKKQLERKTMKLSVLCQHDERTSGSPLGTCHVDFYTLATGTVDHNLPLLDVEGSTVGRMFFSVEMVQVTEVVVMLKEIHVKNLRSSEEDIFNLNPYLKYGYSKDWPAIVDNKMKATYSETQHRTPSPSWDERQMPWLKFRASLNELVRESLVMHVTHKGKLTNTTLGRCNLLFRTLVDGGKSFKEEDLISFKGPLNKKDSGTTIEGRLLFKHLPIFAQMKAVTGGRPAVHTEQGIYDAVPLLTWVPKPTVNVTHSDTPSAEVGTPKTARKGRGASEIVEKRSQEEPITQADRVRQKLGHSDGASKKSKEKKEKEKEKEKDLSNSAPPKPKNKLLSEVPTADLISFTPPSARKRSTSLAPHMLFPGATMSGGSNSGDDFMITRDDSSTMFPSTRGNILSVEQVPQSQPLYGQPQVQFQGQPQQHQPQAQFQGQPQQQQHPAQFQGQPQFQGQQPQVQFQGQPQQHQPQVQFQQQQPQVQFQGQQFQAQQTQAVGFPPVQVDQQTPNPFAAANTGAVQTETTFNPFAPQSVQQTQEPSFNPFSD